MTIYPRRHGKVVMVLLAIALLSACSQTPTTDNLSVSASGTSTPLTEPQQQLYEKALRHGQAGDYSAAAEQIERLVQQRPARAELWVHLATAYYHNDHGPQAEKALENALKLNPDLASAHNLAGTMALKRAEIETAEQHFEAALRQDPRSADAHYNLGLLYDTYYQDLSSAIEHYEAYLALVDSDERTAQWVRQLQSALERQGG
ncbi:tetratricopeptide repeat protein [Marinimicrobium agarilyticum]|uniref:tetratricopeptide repeat protein n=1 Tax=Marinimicrobium agarilyticum TaxID=306546 RepID=UPI0004085538|nr:tetratricopeptide repeat protein [Marinimicrobium agarilyticum]